MVEVCRMWPDDKGPCMKSVSEIGFVSEKPSLSMGSLYKSRILTMPIGSLCTEVSLF